MEILSYMLLFCTIKSNKENYKRMMFAALYEYLIHIGMTLERNITNRNNDHLLFLSAEMFQKPLANSVERDQTAPLGADCSGSTLFASVLNSSVMFGSYLQQTTSADDIFRCSFYLTL